MVAGAKQAGLSISETADLRFSCITIAFTENGSKNRKYPVSGSCVDRNALMMCEVIGELADWFEMMERQQ